MDVFDDLPLLKVDFIFNSFLDNKFKVTLFSPFDSDEKFIQFTVDKPTKDLDDIRMI